MTKGYFLLPEEKQAATFELRKWKAIPREMTWSLACSQVLVHRQVRKTNMTRRRFLI
jgi:hypothetical protein